MQGLADGYFIIPYTLANFLSAEIRTEAIPTTHPAFEEAEKAVSDKIQKLMNIKGTKSVDHFHRELGKIMWNKCGMARNEKGLTEAITEIQQLREQFWKDVRIPGEIESMNPELDKAQRVADFLELGELMCHDALDRKESCGAHFREESQTPEGEALRIDDQYSYVSAWQYTPQGEVLNKEQLIFEVSKPTQRSYK